MTMSIPSISITTMPQFQNLSPSPVRSINCGLAGRICINWKKVALIAAAAAAVAAAAAAFFFGLTFVGIACTVIAGISLYGALSVNKNEQMQRLQKQVEGLSLQIDTLDTLHKKLTHEADELKSVKTKLISEIEIHRETAENLNVVNDALNKNNTELQAHVDELTLLAEEAKFQEQKRNEEIDALNTQWQELHKELSAFAQEHLELAELSGLFEQNIQAIDTNREELKHAIDDFQKQSETQHTEISKNLHLVKLIQKQFSSQQQQKDELNKKISALQNVIDSIQSASDSQKNLIAPLVDIEEKISVRSLELERLEKQLIIAKEELKKTAESLQQATEGLRVTTENRKREDTRRITIQLNLDSLKKQFQMVEANLEKKIFELEQVNKKLESNLEKQT